MLPLNKDEGGLIAFFYFTTENTEDTEKTHAEGIRLGCGYNLQSPILILKGLKDDGIKMVKNHLCTSAICLKFKEHQTNFTAPETKRPALGRRQVFWFGKKIKSSFLTNT
jgi:hypothetical protein